MTSNEGEKKGVGALCKAMAGKAVYVGLRRQKTTLFHLHA